MSHKRSAVLKQRGVQSSSCVCTCSGQVVRTLNGRHSELDIIRFAGMKIQNMAKRTGRSTNVCHRSEDRSVPDSPHKTHSDPGLISNKTLKKRRTCETLGQSGVRPSLFLTRAPMHTVYAMLRTIQHIAIYYGGYVDQTETLITCIVPGLAC